MLDAPLFHPNLFGRSGAAFSKRRERPNARTKRLAVRVLVRPEREQLQRLMTPDVRASVRPNAPNKTPFSAFGQLLGDFIGLSIVAFGRLFGSADDVKAQSRLAALLRYAPFSERAFDQLFALELL